MKTYTLRLRPGQDLRCEVEAFAAAHQLQAGLVLACTGSLTQAALRMADASSTTQLQGTFKIVSLVGTLKPDGSHQHISISDHQGATCEGHLREGSFVYTTAEISLGGLDQTTFSRRLDTAAGYDELVVDGTS